jgi:hypothetical protein
MDCQIPCIPPYSNFSTNFIHFYEIYTCSTCLLAYPSQTSIFIPSSTIISSALTHFSHQLVSIESFLPLLVHLNFLYILDILNACHQKMDALQLKLRATVAESKWYELIEVMRDVEDMRREFVRKAGYTEYFLRKEMMELGRQRGLERRINKSYMEKIRQDDDFTQKIKQQFEVKMQKKIGNLSRSITNRLTD